MKRIVVRLAAAFLFVVIVYSMLPFSLPLVVILLLMLVGFKLVVR